MLIRFLSWDSLTICPYIHLVGPVLAVRPKASIYISPLTTPPVAEAVGKLLLPSSRLHGQGLDGTELPVYPLHLCLSQPHPTRYQATTTFPPTLLLLSWISGSRSVPLPVLPRSKESHQPRVFSPLPSCLICMLLETANQLAPVLGYTRPLSDTPHRKTPDPLLQN